MVNLVYYLKNLLFYIFHYFIIILTLGHCPLLLYYYINFRSSFFWKYMSFFFGISLSNPLFSVSLSIAYGLFYGKVFEILFITNQMRSSFSCFLNCSFWSSFKYICSKLFCMLKTFWLYLLCRFLPAFLLIFLAKDKNPQPFTSIQSFGRTK